MVELWVSLIRNAACVLKSLLPPHYTVMQPLMSFPLSILDGQSLDPFTSLEGFIGLLQIAGAGFNLWKGIKGLTGGIVTAEYVVRQVVDPTVYQSQLLGRICIAGWRNALSDYDLSGEGKRKEINILSDVLGRQDAANNRRIISGICQLVIGLGFLCLASFSWKLAGVVTAATAVLILEVALAILLTIAVAGVSKVFKVTGKVQELERPTGSDVDVMEFLAPLATSEFPWEPDVTISPTVAVLKEHMKGMSKIGKVVSEIRLEDYRRLAQVAKRQAMLDAFIILLNVAAFLGYGTIPLDVFFPKRSMLTTMLPPGPTAWWGNFVGDVAWTIEPATMFLAPILLLRRTQPQLQKIKSE